MFPGHNFCKSRCREGGNAFSLCPCSHVVRGCGVSTPARAEFGSLILTRHSLRPRWAGRGVCVCVCSVQIYHNQDIRPFRHSRVSLHIERSKLSWELRGGMRTAIIACTALSGRTCVYVFMLSAHLNILVPFPLGGGVLSAWSSVRGSMFSRLCPMGMCQRAYPRRWARGCTLLTP